MICGVIGILSYDEVFVASGGKAITPYVITILVLVILTIYKGGKTGAPKNIGVPFFRENR